MYELNQILVYGNSGVCRLVDIRTENFTDKPALYYILSPVFSSQSTFYIPIENSKLSSMLRPVMMKETLHEMVLTAKHSNACWESNDRVRAENFNRVVSKGMSSELLTIFKSLIIHKHDLKSGVKKLHHADKRILELCEKIVGEEFAYAFGVEIDDALSHIQHELVA